MRAVQMREQRHKAAAEDATPLRAAIYARHSSSKQNPKSCDEQISHIKYLLGKGDIKSRLYPARTLDAPPDWVIKDEAISGRTADRNGYQIILDAMSAKVKPFEVLLLDDLTRANRDLGNTLELYQLAQYAGIEIISVSENLSSADPNSKVYFTVKGMIGDWSNEAHAMRTLRGMEAKVLKGLSCGDIPYGYKTEATSCDPEGIRRDFKIVIDEPRAVVVRRIFKMFSEGYGRVAIAKRLNKDKIPWPGFFSKPVIGKGWEATTIFRILHNEKFIGIWMWKRSTYKLNPITGQKTQHKRPEHEWVSHHEGQKCREDLRIVSQQLWNRVRKVFEEIHQDENHGRWGRYVSRVPLHMLSGILKCGECGGSMVLITGNKGGFYGCRNAHRRDICSNKKLVRRFKMEKAIVGHVTKMLTDEAVFESAASHYNTLMREKMNRGRENIYAYEQELAAIEVELQNLAEGIAKGAGSETLVKSIEGKEKRKRWLVYQIRQIRANDQEKVFVTPVAMKVKFKKLVDTLGKHPREACEALKKVFPEGVSMKWNTDKWEIMTLAVLDTSRLEISKIVIE